MVERPFTVKINQESLKYLLEQKIGTPAQQKWFAKLLGYNFVVEYKKGKDNLMADALPGKLRLKNLILMMMFLIGFYAWFLS